MQGIEFRRMIEAINRQAASDHGYDDVDKYVELYSILCDFYMKTIAHPGELDDSPFMHTSDDARKFANDFLDRLAREELLIVSC
ncbi:hypothetical protein [Streptomyces sp. TE33382]